MMEVQLGGRLVAAGDDAAGMWREDELWIGRQSIPIQYGHWLAYSSWSHCRCLDNGGRAILTHAPTG